MDNNSYIRPRYEFEHRAFRDMFLNVPSNVFNYLSRVGNDAFLNVYRFLLDLYDIPEIAEYENCISVEVPEGINCIHISLAEPSAMLDCSGIVLYYDPEAEEHRYLTVEYDVSEDAFLPYEWIDGNSHSVLGGFNHDSDKVLDVIYNMLSENDSGDPIVETNIKIK